MTWNRRCTALAGLTLLIAFSGSCSARVSDFSTEAGECYQGSVVRDEFVRAGFLADTNLWLTLDTKALLEAAPAAVVMSTSDGIFDASVAHVLPQLRHDALSLLDFPGGRVRNFLAYAQAVQGPKATMVLSLMENGRVEVRILRPDENPEDGRDDTLFGVFRLDLDDGCPFDADTRGNR